MSIEQENQPDSKNIISLETELDKIISEAIENVKTNTKTNFKLLFDILYSASITDSKAYNDITYLLGLKMIEPHIRSGKITFSRETDFPDKVNQLKN